MPLRPFAAIKEAEKRFNWHKHRFRDAIRLRNPDAPPPVIVYSAPKTASAAVYKALRRAPRLLVFKSHTLRPGHWRRRRLDPAWQPGWTGMWRDHWHTDQLLHQLVIRPARPSRFITLVRDPVAANISGFVYFTEYWFPGRPTPDILAGMTDDQLTTAFFERYPHHISTDWLNLEPRATLDINPLESPFPHEQGHTTLRRGPFELLILRTETPDHTKSTAIARFLNIAPIPIPRFNTAADYGLRETIRRLRAIVARHHDYIEQHLNHPTTAHFWSPAERDAMRDHHRSAH